MKGGKKKKNEDVGLIAEMNAAPQRPPLHQPVSLSQWNPSLFTKQSQSMPLSTISSGPLAKLVLRNSQSDAQFV